MKMKKYICLIAAVCLIGTAAFCSYHIYDHYADEAEQTEAFENIAEIVEQAQAEDGNAPEVPLTEEENILTGERPLVGVSGSTCAIRQL